MTTIGEAALQKDVTRYMRSVQRDLESVGLAESESLGAEVVGLVNEQLARVQSLGGIVRVLDAAYGTILPETSPFGVLSGRLGKEETILFMVGALTAASEIIEAVRLRTE